MIVYSVTISLDPNVHSEWLTYMKETHIPDVMNTGCFVDSKMFRILSTQDEGEISYNLQYYCETMEDFNKYQNDFAKALQEEHNAKYTGKAFAFRTLLESI